MGDGQWLVDAALVVRLNHWPSTIDHRRAAPAATAHAGWSGRGAA